MKKYRKGKLALAVIASLSQRGQLLSEGINHVEWPGHESITDLFKLLTSTSFSICAISDPIIIIGLLGGLFFILYILFTEDSFHGSHPIP